MVDEKILEIAERNRNNTVDDLSEYFMQQEYYQQLEAYDVCPIAGLHLKLRSLLMQEDTSLENISSVECGRLLYTTNSKAELFVMLNELLEYEEYLIGRLLIKYETVNA